jgi:hypothetical protein
MSEAKKWFPWWLPAWSAVLVISALGAGFIETGRRGTLVGRYDRIHERMPEADAVAILGPPLTVTEAHALHRSLLRPEAFVFPTSWSTNPLAHYFTHMQVWPPVTPLPVITKSYIWRDGPAEARLVMMRQYRGRYKGDWSDDWVVGQADLQVDNAPFGSWHVRRWAEQAYTAIHGPRR